MRIWDVESGALRTSLMAHTGPVNRLVISGDGQTLLTASDDRHAAIDPENDAAKAALDEHAAFRDRLLRGQ